ncbi:MAG TPA: glycosyltransferase [Anaerolineae bacterium]
MQREVLGASVIIPTRNRCHRLRQTLDSLGRQTFPSTDFEVIVVADGCQDETAEMVSDYQASYDLHLVDQPNQGPAAARNNGAAKARGQLLIFIDDDIEATPTLVEAHLLAHWRRPGGVVIGYLPPVLYQQKGFFRATLRGWWENMFDRMRERGHRFTYTDLLSGNFSLPVELFNSINGFDVSFTCHEDFELGVRLQKVGASFSFAPNAMGYHHELTDLNRVFQRKYAEGEADVQLGTRHPELRSDLLMARLYHYARLPSRFMSFWVFNWPQVSDTLARLFQQGLTLYEWVRARRLWQRTVDGLMAYWYWRGVGQELESWQAVSKFLTEVAGRSEEVAEAELELDISWGLETAEQLLDEIGPAGAFIRFGTQPVGRIEPQPGAERLQGVHLRRILATDLSVPFVRALVLSSVITALTDQDALIATCEGGTDRRKA